MTYHIAKNGEKSGPFEKDEVYRRLVSGELSGTDLGWHDGMAEWEPLSKLIPPPLAQPVFAPSGVFATTSAPQAVAAPPQGTSGLAIASLVCGILGFLTLGLAGLPAVITGHLAISRIRKSAGALGGQGLAIAGLIMGYLGIVLTIMIVLVASMAAPAFAKVQTQGQQMKVVSNARQLVIAMKMYAAEHDGNYPPSLETLYTEQITTDRKLLEFPEAMDVPGQGWDYRGAELTDHSEGNAILLVTKQADLSKKKIVAHNDGSVQVVKESDAP
ncbi:MAG: DUF4190 domain-containing protein [Prosthecobacter sp.]|uniref:DUF4190 domain-containing protein n=1 Tax=Prosthecobacter sp. TaxID=1965333 RepID=UPI00260C70AF|nr:DUF4190 domain-containing protein [Prosthecobacter sp.]MCF7789048.1 DUF4190 domain-containing protein [Prosthecobacter sp.]